MSVKSAIKLLPRHLQEAALKLDGQGQRAIEEFRLRAGRPCGMVRQGREERLSGTIVTPRELAQVLEVATQGSMHTAVESLRQGYVTVDGGHRLGLGGTAVVSGGEVRMIRDVSSITIRVAHQMPGVSLPFLEKLWDGPALRDTLILSPPGLGKTTLLRDVIRQISDGFGDRPPLRVAVADERGELAASWQGQPQLDVGGHTDVLEGCPKAAAVMMLLRAHGPQVVALDEITAPADAEAIRAASHCGVTLLATAHGEGAEDLNTRDVYKGLNGYFKRLVTIAKRDDSGSGGGVRVYEVTAL